MDLYCSATYRQDLRLAAEDSVGLDRLAGKRVLITVARVTIGSFLVDLILDYS